MENRGLFRHGLSLPEKCTQSHQQSLYSKADVCRHGGSRPHQLVPFSCASYHGCRTMRWPPPGSPGQSSTTATGPAEPSPAGLGTSKWGRHSMRGRLMLHRWAESSSCASECSGGLSGAALMLGSKQNLTESADPFFLSPLPRHRSPTPACCTLDCNPHTTSGLHVMQTNKALNLVSSTRV